MLVKKNHLFILLVIKNIDCSVAPFGYMYIICIYLNYNIM